MCGYCMVWMGKVKSEYHPPQPKCSKISLKNKLLLTFLVFVHIFLYLCSELQKAIYNTINILLY